MYLINILYKKITSLINKKYVLILFCIINFTAIDAMHLQKNIEKEQLNTSQVLKSTKNTKHQSDLNYLSKKQKKLEYNSDSDEENAALITENNKINAIKSQLLNNIRVEQDVLHKWQLIFTITSGLVLLIFTFIDEKIFCLLK